MYSTYIISLAINIYRSLCAFSMFSARNKYLPKLLSSFALHTGNNCTSLKDETKYLLEKRKRN